MTLQHRNLIVGGRDAPVGRYPYYARLDYNHRFGCGGALISPEFVLTAAHCAEPKDLFSCTATIGAVTRMESHPRAQQFITENNNHTLIHKRQVLEIFRYPVYIDPLNDIALLRIAPIPDAVTVQINRNRTLTFQGESVTVVGCGLTSNNGHVADILQEVQLEMVKPGLCDERYDGDVRPKSMICAADPGHDSCVGDSGGPLLMRNEQGLAQYDVQVGVVSFGKACASRTYPGVYSDVSYYAEWIDDILCQHSSIPPSHCTRPAPTCQDRPGWIKLHTQRYSFTQSCAWLAAEAYRIESFCHSQENGQAWTHCPLTCHGCTYESDDDSVFASYRLSIDRGFPHRRKDGPTTTADRWGRDASLIDSGHRVTSSAFRGVVALGVVGCGVGGILAAISMALWSRRHQQVRRTTGSSKIQSHYGSDEDDNGAGNFGHDGGRRCFTTEATADILASAAGTNVKEGPHESTPLL